MCREEASQGGVSDILEERIKTFCFLNILDENISWLCLDSLGCRMEKKINFSSLEEKHPIYTTIAPLR